jgi:hypothetical protein
MTLNTTDFGRYRLEGTSASTLLPNFVPPPVTLCATKSGSPACEAIASDLRRGAARFAWPLGAASLIQLALERQYWSAAYFAWLIVILVYAVLQHGLLRQPSPGRIRVALLANFLAIGVGYTMIGTALAATPGWRADGALYQIERTVFGADPQRFLAPWRTPWLSTIAILGYVSFVGFLLYLFLAEVFRLNRSTGRLQFGLMSLYGIGYAGYILFPAAGPVFYHPVLLPPLVHSSVSAYLSAWVIKCCSRVDAWPSLHAAVCCFALIWTFRRHRGVFCLLILPGAALMLGAVYFQFHYFIDLLAGCLLGILGLRPVFAADPIPLEPTTGG